MRCWQAKPWSAVMTTRYTACRTIGSCRSCIAMAGSHKFRPACFTAVVAIAGERLRVAWSNAGIVCIEEESRTAKRSMEGRTRMQLVDKTMPPALREALKIAARGRRVDVPLDLGWAREFERDVLEAARQIPYGQTRSYSWLARTARRPLAVRAAASVMARNPLWRLVPCHRVIYADGRVGPYGSSGNQRKRRLLAREGVVLPAGRRGTRKGMPSARVQRRPRR